jgi:hypothetical protein
LVPDGFRTCKAEDLAKYEARRSILNLHRLRLLRYSVGRAEYKLQRSILRPTCLSVESVGRAWIEHALRALPPPVRCRTSRPPVAKITHPIAQAGRKGQSNGQEKF